MDPVGESSTSHRSDGLELPLGALDFDAGLNSSAAWAGHFESEATPQAADVHGAPVDLERSWAPSSGTPARVLKPFSGEADASELSVAAGQEIFVVMEDVMPGWSLVRIEGEGDSERMGLLPTSHFALTTNFELSPQVIANTPPVIPATLPMLDASPSSSVDTPKREAVRSLPPIEPQTTGAASRRLRGKSFNRFSSFVTSGAEEWIEHGSSGDLAPPSATVRRLPSDDSQDGMVHPGLLETSESFQVDTPPAWRATTPSFRVLVHSPSKRASTIGMAYTVYSVTSSFAEGPVDQVTVFRRFSQFAFLHAALSRRLPGVAIPPLPEKQYSGRFNTQFVEARRGDLERWINRIVRHPLCRATEVMMFFLGCEDDMEWKRRLPAFLAAYPTPGPSFYSHVYHPHFNVDAEEADTVGRRFGAYLDVVGRNVSRFREIFTQVRDAGVASATASRAFSYSLLRLISPTTGDTEDRGSPTTYATSPSSGGPPDAPSSGHDAQKWTPHNRAWCWRENCAECLGLTQAFQRVAVSLQAVADLQDDHARRVQLVTHEALKDTAHPSKIYAPVLHIHRASLARYTEASADDHPSDSLGQPERAARAEAVLNATLAEFDVYHTQKNEDFTQIVREHLDGEIQLYEKVLAKLRTARSALRAPALEGSPSGSERPDDSDDVLKPTIYDRDLYNGSAEARSSRSGEEPLTAPTPHILDATSSLSKFGLVGLNSGMGLEPVAQAVKESVGSLLGLSPSPSAFAPTAAGRNSPWRLHAAHTGLQSEIPGTPSRPDLDRRQNVPATVENPESPRSTPAAAPAGSVFSKFW